MTVLLFLRMRKSEAFLARKSVKFIGVNRGSKKLCTMLGRCVREMCVFIWVRDVRVLAG